MSGAGFGAKLGDLAGALLTLEVNTIVKAGMSAQKMPRNTAASCSIRATACRRC